MTWVFTQYFGSLFFAKYIHYNKYYVNSSFLDFFLNHVVTVDFLEYKVQCLSKLSISVQKKQVPVFNLYLGNLPRYCIQYLDNA